MQRKVIKTVTGMKAYEQAIKQLSENIEEIEREMKRLMKRGRQLSSLNQDLDEYDRGHWHDYCLQRI